MLRVIAGTARGRRLKGPAPRKTRSGKDAGTSVTRPTSDLIRGVIFNMLDAMGAGYDRVLDLYAGTGALGIEALSRGDGDAVFIENDQGAITVIRDNLRACRFEDRAQVLSLTTERAPKRLAEHAHFTLILADPPYYDEGAPEAVAAVAGSSLVGPETVFVYEHHRSIEPPDTLGDLPLYRSRRHGDTVVSIYAGEGALDREEDAT
jgi:16S rRNA (guanine(966)-N(2))-methyltransferase RsmD